MKLTPLHIKTQEFSKVMRGYEPEEVHTFLEKLAGDIQALLNENEMLKKEIDTLNKKLVEQGKKEEEIQHLKYQARENADQIVEAAKERTETIIKEAEARASMILENANRKAAELKDALEVLREEKNLIISRLKAIVSSQAKLLEGKVIDAGQETAVNKQPEKSEDVDIDVDDIVNRLL